MQNAHPTCGDPHPLAKALRLGAAIVLALGLAACQEREADTTAEQAPAVAQHGAQPQVESAAGEQTQAPGTLAAQIAELKSSRQPPAEAAQTAAAELAKLREQGIAARAIRAGQQAPDFTLANSAGEEFQLSQMLAQGPTVLIFFRGAW
jgi:hypothetical protein